MTFNPDYAIEFTTLALIIEPMGFKKSFDLSQDR
jgi:hypothetical protein